MEEWKRERAHSVDKLERERAHSVERLTEGSDPVQKLGYGAEK